MSYVAGDILEITYNHPVTGSGTLYCKANEDSQVDKGGYRSEDDDAMVTGDGQIIDKINRKRWKPSESHLAALREGCIKASRKKIMQIDKNTNEIIKIWDSLSEACDELKIHITLLSLCLHNKRKSTGGFKWKLVS